LLLTESEKETMKKIKQIVLGFLASLLLATGAQAQA
jgi:hypothetical protein